VSVNIERRDMMAKVEKSIEINAPVSEVFAVANDWHKVLDYMESFTKFEPTTEKEEGAGSRFAYALKAAGVEMKGELEVSEWEKDKGWRMTSVAGMKTEAQWLFEPVTENRSRVTFVTEYEVPGSFLGAIADKLVVERTNEANAEKSLQNIKRLVEGG
jgi:uncharacterized membrane protein